MKCGRFAWLPLCAFLAACGGSDEEKSDAPGGDGAPYTVKIGPLDVEKYEERTQCVVKSLGNTEQVRVARFDNSISSSSHHLIVYRSNDAVEQPEPFDCLPFRETLDPSKGAPVMITQKHADTLELPEGVAYTLEPNQMIRLELHYINPSDKAVKVEASTTLTVLPEEKFENEADFLFIGTPDIFVDAKTTATIGPKYFPIPSEFETAKFFAVTGHTHQFGTNVKVWTSPAEDGADTAVYDVADWRWDEPATVVHDPPFQVPAAGGYRFQCDYDNTSDQSLSFGESAEKEMCFFWAYYYPSQGAKVCFHTTKYTSGSTFNFCCPGHFACEYILGSGAF